MIFEKYIKHAVGFVILIMAIAVIYRILIDEELGASHITGIVVIGGLALLLVVLERVKELTAGSKGITAKLREINTEISDIHNFMLKGIDKDSSGVLEQIKDRRIPRPATKEEKNQLKFRLRVLREKAYILRDESKCTSISKAVSSFDNAAECFVITELGEEHLRQIKREANKQVNKVAAR